MTCQILVSNKSNTPRSEIIAVVDGDHIWTKNETMQSWIASGQSADTWNRKFSLVIVEDANVEDLLYLKDKRIIYATNPPEIDGNRYRFIVPSEDTALYQSLLLTGQVTEKVAVVLAHIEDRG